MKSAYGEIMAITFEHTKKGYILLTNHQALKERAEALGYEAAVVFDGDTLSEEDIAYLVRNRKSLVRILYRPDHRKPCGYSSRVVASIGDGSQNLYDITIDLAGNELIKGGHIESLDDAVRNFPPVRHIEWCLQRDRIIKETDFTDRCGNCRAYMKPGYRYCIYCGTRRGGGSFEPFWNKSYGVYGPPIKTKYKCLKCGKSWITVVSGGDKGKYCPQCGKKAARIVERKADYSIWDMLFDGKGEGDHGYSV